ncbi:MAG TPA: ACR3 family arsenite efflux transporter [Acidimicrobiales bacterium]|nr:ACR3 family arsenite efflux transporter [Acidimicrobiales bacterium]
MVEKRPAPGRTTEPTVLGRLSVLDRFLPVWILLAMGLGLGLGRGVPGVGHALDAAQVIQGVSAPIFVGLLVMMYPVLAKVRYGQVRRVTADRRMLATSLVLNWVVGPALMFALAWALLPHQPAYRTGLIIVGLARCIAMVLIWNDLSGGDGEAAAVLVALNAVFQILAYAGLGYLYLVALPSWLGLPTAGLHVSIALIATSVAIFLGVPLVAGFLTRTLGEATRGRSWYEGRFLPRIGPFALYGLLFTVVVLFALQGRAITTRPLDVVRIAAPLVCYFGIMWSGSFLLGRALGLSYPRTATLSFTAAGNNFELAIAVAIGAFGATSGEALAGVVGPLIEVPTLVGLVYVALWARTRLFSPELAPAAGGDAPGAWRRGMTSPVAGNDGMEDGEMSTEQDGPGAPRVLFVCVHNAGRSQMAAALLAHHAHGRLRVASAGSEPAGQLNPAVVAAMAEVGLDLAGEVPRALTDEAARGADVVVTMGCGDACPVYPGARRLDWDLPDPAGKPVEEVRPIRDEIDRRVRALLGELLPRSPGG